MSPVAAPTYPYPPLTDSGFLLVLSLCYPTAIRGGLATVSGEWRLVDGMSVMMGHKVSVWFVVVTSFLSAFEAWWSYACRAAFGLIRPLLLSIQLISTRSRRIAHSHLTTGCYHGPDPLRQRCRAVPRYVDLGFRVDVRRIATTSSYVEGEATITPE